MQISLSSLIWTNHDLMLFEMWPKLFIAMTLPPCALDFNALTRTFLPPPGSLRDNQGREGGQSVRSRRQRGGM